jgi:hypothetical protein
MADGGFFGDRALLDRVLARPDIGPLALGREIALRPDLPVSFLCRGPVIEIGPAALAAPSLDVTVRHALELALALELLPDDPALAGLVAARVAALFTALEQDRDGAVPAWHAIFAAAAPPPAEALETLWPTLVAHQEQQPWLRPRTLARLAELWPLAGPAEHLMGIGGDTRLRLDPATGLNVYGCSPRPRPWAVTFASSTASSVSERGYDGAEQARRRVLVEAARHGAAESQHRAVRRIKDEIRRHYGLTDAVEIVLAPSGTDGELSALAVALLGGEAPLANILIAPEETGSGVPLAATGRHFATLTARGVAVEKGALIAGFPSGIELEAVAIRGAQGAMRRDSAIAADCAAAAARALAAGRRVLLHVLDVSKTGVRAPGDIPYADHADVDIVVDACQARLSAESLRRYLERDFMVLITGSKFFTGPPFAGALLLPPRFAARFAGPRALAPGLGDYFGRFDWPAGPAAAGLPAEANTGLACRWAAALAEMAAFAAVPDAEIIAVLRQFGQRVRTGIKANPDLVLHESPHAMRRDAAARWDDLPTVFTFSLLAPGDPRAPLGPEDARLVYELLNSDLSDALPPVLSKTERHLAALRCHIGQPVPLRDGDGIAGALRLCAGARLVSGEPSRAALEPAQRLAGEIADSLAVLDKISLILRHFARLKEARPRPSYS